VGHSRRPFERHATASQSHHSRSILGRSESLDCRLPSASSTTSLFRRLSFSLELLPTPLHPTISLPFCHPTTPQHILFAFSASFKERSLDLEECRTFPVRTNVSTARFRKRCSVLGRRRRRGGGIGGREGSRKGEGRSE